MVFSCTDPESCSSQLPRFEQEESAFAARREFFDEMASQHDQVGAISYLPVSLLPESSAAHNSDPWSRDESFDALLKEATSGGFSKSSVNYPERMGEQIALLRHPVAVSLLADKLAVQNYEYRKDKLAKVLVWIVRQEAEDRRESVFSYFHREVEPLLKTAESRSRVQSMLAGRQEEASTEELLDASASLWLYKHAPFSDRVKFLLFCDEDEVSGYVPREDENFQEYDNSGVVGSMNVSLGDLPAGFIAYDIETDTANGYGLRPTRSQITEIVLSSHDKSWVLSGDEKFILTKFAEMLNELPSGTTLVGWNNHSFDNLSLQTRAQFHGIKNWRGRLIPVRNSTNFQSAGPSRDNQSLEWVNSSGAVLSDRDLFQEKTVFDLRRGERFTLGLKNFLKSFDCNPIQVDRSRLHLLSEQERVDYVLSDGIATLRALTELERMKMEFFIQEPSPSNSASMWV